ncbi:immunity protein YezG family protein [Lacticaseibacillus absianus]|uniref:immunity protein YezG family protein n=1 Tax=Lacticaseibacillus absianus TaxID=2729623 RepID=UPI0015CC1633|nr:immunity protein YezG family protein [Lacticaseibacillus absianus]
MLEQEIQAVYQEIAEKVVSMMPISEWSDFYFWGQVSDGVSSAEFYYRGSVNAPYQDSGRIATDYHTSERGYLDDLRVLIKLAEKNAKIFQSYNQEPWTWMAMHVDSSGHLSVDYTYTDWENSFLDNGIQEMYFKHLYLGEAPTDPEEQAELAEAEAWVKQTPEAIARRDKTKRDWSDQVNGR